MEEIFKKSLMLDAGIGITEIYTKEFRKGEIIEHMS